VDRRDGAEGADAVNTPDYWTPEHFEADERDTNGGRYRPLPDVDAVNTCGYAGPHDEDCAGCSTERLDRASE
jgi:hypothetical protein